MKTCYQYTKEDMKEINISAMTLEEIATYLKCSVSKARIILLRLGFNNYLRPKHFKLKQVFDMPVDIFKELLSHNTIIEIAKNNNTTVKAVRNYMLKHNIKINKKKSMYTKRLAAIYDHIRKKCYENKDINICNEWLLNRKQFYAWAFENGYKDNLTLSRIDVNKGYSPDNCVWITKKSKLV